MLPVDNEYRCCNQHLDYPTPVIGTIKFLGKEFWCPYCGAKYEMFDGFKYYPKNLKLAIRLAMFNKIACDFLSTNKSDYHYNQRPDSFLSNEPDWKIGYYCFNLGLRFNPNELKIGDKLYGLTGKEYFVVNNEEQLFVSNSENVLRPVNKNLKNYDLFIIPSAEIIAGLFLKNYDQVR